VPYRGDLTELEVPKSLLKKVNSWRRGGDRIALTSTEARRLLKYNVTVDANGCWVWSSLLYPSGYGCLPNRLRHAIGLGTRRVHVAAYTLWKTAPAKGELVCHDCRPAPDNKQCCNPKHLWVGTSKDNANDAARKGLLQRTDEFRAKVSAGLTGRPVSMATRQKIRARLKGRPGTPHTEEAKAKIREAGTGRMHTEASKKKMRAKRLAYYAKKRAEK
jgi:hypothetical protein